MFTPKSLSANGTIDLGDCGQGRPGEIVFHVTGISGGAGLVTPKAQILGSSKTAVAVAYRKLSDGTTATAAIGTDGLYAVPCNGCKVILDYAFTSGSVSVDATPVHY
jgi:hypothetical protein